MRFIHQNPQSAMKKRFRWGSFDTSATWKIKYWKVLDGKMDLPYLHCSLIPLEGGICSQCSANARRRLLTHRYCRSHSSENDEKNFM